MCVENIFCTWQQKFKEVSSDCKFSNTIQPQKEKFSAITIHQKEKKLINVLAEIVCLDP